jgi:hypothetical protein
MVEKTAAWRQRRAADMRAYRKRQNAGIELFYNPRSPQDFYHTLGSMRYHVITMLAYMSDNHRGSGGSNPASIM